MSLLVAMSLVLTLFQSPPNQSRAIVAGIVVDDESQKPVAGAELTLMRTGQPSIPFRASPHVAVTDRDGRYVFEGIEAGEYRVTVQKTGYVRLEGPDVQPVSVRSGVTRESLNFSLKKGAAIVGRVLDENGEPLLGAQVTVLRKPPAHLSQAAVQSKLPLFPAGQMAQTNDLGEFRVFGLLPHDEYFVSAIPGSIFAESAPTQSTVLMPTFFPSALNWHEGQPVAVGAGQTSSDVVIRMVSLPAFTVSGAVLDETGKPVANALIQLMPDEASESPFMRRHGMPSHTDDSGRFSINNVTHGSYTLLAIAPLVTAKAPKRQDGMSISSGSGGFSFSGGLAGGTIGGGVTTETIDGTTTEYRHDAGTRVSITIEQANVSGLEIIVRRPAR